MSLPEQKVLFHNAFTATSSESAIIKPCYQHVGCGTDPHRVSKFDGPSVFPVVAWRGPQKIKHVHYDSPVMVDFPLGNYSKKQLKQNRGSGYSLFAKATEISEPVHFQGTLLCWSSVNSVCNRLQQWPKVSMGCQVSYPNWPIDRESNDNLTDFELLEFEAAPVYPYNTHFILCMIRGNNDGL